MIAGLARCATRASDIASRFASVPELQNRTSSIDGNRSQTAAASRAS